MARSIRSRRRQAARVAVLLLPVALTTPLLARTALAKAKTPTPVISSKPATPTNATGATFAFTDTAAGATFTCQLDTGAASACSSPKTYTGIAGGNHQFSVRAQASGKAPSNWVRASWSVDVTPPAVPTVSQPATPTSSTAVSITFTDSDATTAGFTCSLDNATGAACTSPFTASGLAESAHSLAVTALDALGNGATRTVQWVVDHTAPAVPVVVGPSSPTNATSASIVFSDSAADVTSYTCALDAGAPVTCTSPWSIAGPLSEGSHGVVVRAIDGSGNATTGQTQWVVDVTAPSAPFIQAGPASPTNQTGADFTISDNDPSAILQCALDAAAWTACPAAVHEDVVAGSHSLNVRAIDAAGNTSAVDTWSWLVDTTAPAPASFTGGPANPSNDTAPEFYFAATDSSVNGFLCSLDDAAYAACDSGDIFAVTGDGMHTLAVENVDAANNISSPTTYTWLLDTTAPSAPSLTASPADVSNAAGATFGLSEADSDAALACALDGAAPAPCAATYDTGPLADGVHNFVVTATDLAGNVSTVGDSWTIDTVAPVAPVLDTLALPASPTSVDSISLPFSDSEAGVTFTCAVDGASATGCTSPLSLSALTDGPHAIVVRAVDAAGNASDAASHAWTVDTTAPAAPSFVGSTPGTTSSTTVSIGFDDSETGMTFACSLDDATPVACTSPYVATGLTEGSHNFTVTATDGAGNVSSSTTSFVVDGTAPPVPTFPASNAATTNTSSYTLAFSETENGTTTTCSLDGGSASACVSGVTFAGLSDGSHSVQVTATDAAGNSASATFGWITDTTAPA